MESTNRSNTEKCRHHAERVLDYADQIHAALGEWIRTASDYAILDAKPSEDEAGKLFAIARRVYHARRAIGGDPIPFDSARLRLEMAALPSKPERGKG